MEAKACELVVDDGTVRKGLTDADGLAVARAVLNLDVRCRNRGNDCAEDGAYQKQAKEK